MDNDRLGQLERENSLLRVDMEWQTERQGLLFRGSEPTALLFIAPIVTGIAFFCVTLVLAFQPGVNISFLVVLGVSAALLMAGIGGTYGYHKRATFQRALSSYPLRRTAIEQGDSTMSDIP